MINIVSYCRDFKLSPEWLYEYLYDDDIVILYSNMRFFLVHDRPKKRFVSHIFDSFGLLDRYMTAYYGLQTV